MLVVAVALLKTPDDKFFFQRREEGDSQAGLLGLFGGAAEPRETPRETILRKLSEETTLDIDELALKFLGGIKKEIERKSGTEEVTFNVFEGIIEDEFDANEGEIVELKESNIKSKLDEMTSGAEEVIKHFDLA